MAATRAHLLLRLVHTWAETSCVPKPLLEYMVRKTGEDLEVVKPNPGWGLGDWTQSQESGAHHSLSMCPRTSPSTSLSSCRPSPKRGQDSRQSESMPGWLHPHRGDVRPHLRTVTLGDTVPQQRDHGGPGPGSEQSLLHGVWGGPQQGIFQLQLSSWKHADP